MKERMHYILLLLAILLIAGLSLANMQSVTVSFILFRFKIPLILLILLSVLLGAITTILISMPKNFSLRNELAKAKKELKNRNQVGNPTQFFEDIFQMFGFYFRIRLFLLKSSCPKIGRHHFFKKDLSETRMFGICSKNLFPKTGQSYFPLKLLVRMWKMANYLKVASSSMKDEVFCSKNSHPHLERSGFTLREECPNRKQEIILVI